MAKIGFKGLDDYAAKLKELGKDSEAVCKKAVYEGAAIVADAVRGNLESVLSGDSTGELASSMGLSHMTNENGYIYTKLGFAGYDSNGVANQLKAQVLESGSSRQPKRPFVRPAVNATKAKAEAEMKKVIDKEVEKIMK